MRDRNTDYGDPEDNFADIAEFWTTYLDHPITSYDVAAMMILVKCSRMKTSPFAMDHWVDTAGYAACGCEAALHYEEQLHEMRSREDEALDGYKRGTERQGRQNIGQEDSIPEGA